MGRTRCVIPGLVVLLALPPDVGATGTDEVRVEAGLAIDQEARPQDDRLLDERDLDNAGATTILAPEIEAELRRRHSEARAGTGAEHLTWDAGLTRLARSHAMTMAWQLGELVHRRRTMDDRITHDWFSQLWRCAIGSVGENLAWYLTAHPESQDPQSIADELFLQWMDSPSHRANVMNPRHDTIGVGVVVGPDGRFWAVAYVADFNQETHCPDSGADVTAPPSWSLPVAAGPYTELVDLTISVGPTGAGRAEQAALVIKLNPWARVIAGSSNIGEWNPATNGRSGHWFVGDLDDESGILRLTIEFPRGTRSKYAVDDVVLTSDWGGTTPLALRSAR